MKVVEVLLAGPLLVAVVLLLAACTRQLPPPALLLNAQALLPVVFFVAMGILLDRGQLPPPAVD